MDHGIGRTAHPSVGDVAAEEGEGDGDEGKDGVAEGLVGDRRVDVADQDAAEGDHDPRVDPVVQVADPADRELHEAGELSMLRLLLVQQGRLGEVVARSCPRVRVDPGKLAVAVGRQERENQREQQPGPHLARGRLSSCALRGLNLKRGPEECPRRDQRHGVDRYPGQGQASLHLGFFEIGHRSGPFCSVVPSGPPGTHQDFTHRAAPHRPAVEGRASAFAVPWRR